MSAICPSCGASVADTSGSRLFYQCGSYSAGPDYTRTSDLCDLRRELAQSQEHARKLSIKVVDLGKDVERLKARCERVEGVADSMLAYLETACHQETGEHFAKALKEAKEVQP